jgi:hypothetical protein
MDAIFTEKAQRLAGERGRGMSLQFIDRNLGHRHLGGFLLRERGRH